MNIWYICTVECYIALSNDAIMKLAATWMELEDIMVNEVSQKEKRRTILLICGFLDNCVRE